MFSAFRLARQAKQEGKPIAMVTAGQTRADELLDLKLEHSLAFYEHFLSVEQTESLKGDAANNNDPNLLTAFPSAPAVQLIGNGNESGEVEGMGAVQQHEPGFGTRTSARTATRGTRRRATRRCSTRWRCRARGTAH